MLYLFCPKDQVKPGYADRLASQGTPLFATIMGPRNEVDRIRHIIQGGARTLTRLLCPPGYVITDYAVDGIVTLFTKKTMLGVTATIERR